MDHPRPTAYVICGTPRSGSTLLCRMLAETGIAGRPHSYYRDVAYWATLWGVARPEGIEAADFDLAYLTAMRREGEAGTGMFGLRIMWGSVEEAARRLDRTYGGSADIVARFEQAFGPTRYIHLSRLDKVAQAVSLAKAEQSGLWHLNADGGVLEGPQDPAPIFYDGDRLAALVAELESDDDAWSNFFAARRIAALRLTYEAMTEDPQRALQQVLVALGRDPDSARTIAAGTARMADATSREWAERFRRERGA